MDDAQERNENDRSLRRPEMRFIVTSMEEGSIEGRVWVVPQGVRRAREMLLGEAKESAEYQTTKTKADK